MKELNKLIAEFMDVFPRQGEERTGMKEFYSPIDLDISGLPDELTLADDLDFRQWHWIMPVVEKIESFEDDDKCCKYNVNIQQSWVEILDNENLDEIVFMESCGTLLTKKELVYLAVVEFINWYNKNKKA
jgi:hypothetical protein